ncbi:GH39 family glycosyl hydrolase [Planctomicrobium piriforme]|uniref:Endo-1,4-beta-xylanase, GH35 family n=1 Tax=Planctomicrobium piriforme TaxID=1576369 RepID=A0A1I3AYA9_9PLAN|nr:cellulase family glycosylhydrolase [Planctomicrobium piriforme]SFH54361.1 Endo-1,4-beta-xylanase, GH35 family [Planctomicrobium piriforme]
MPFLIMLLLLLTPLFLQAGTPHPSLPKAGSLEGLGVNIHFVDAKPGEIEMIEDGGFQWVRMDLFWSSIETAKGVYNFTGYDRLLAALEKQKIHPIFILAYENNLYCADRSVQTPEARAAYAKWAAACVSHFKGHGILWEIWNEPNHKGFWKPMVNVQEYSSMALEACKAIRTAAPNECIIGPGLANIDLPYVEECFKAGLLDYWDAVSVHPYRQTGPEPAIQEYSQLRQLIAKYAPAGREIPILSAEWGYSTTWFNSDDERQAKYLAREFLVNLSNNIPLSIWYDWHDDGEDAAEKEHRFGIVYFKHFPGRKLPYDPKPAYQAMKTLASTLKRFEFVKRIATTSADDYVLLFQRGKDQRLAVWTSTDIRHEIELPASAGEFEIVSLLGDKRTKLTAKRSSLKVSLSESVQYLIPKVPNQGLADAPVAHPLELTMAPRPGSELLVRVVNPTQQAFQGKATILTSAIIKPKVTEQPLTFATGEMEKVLSFPLPAKLPEIADIGIRIDNEQNQTIAQLLPKKYRMVSADYLKTAQIHPDGEKSVGSDQSMSLASAPPEWPGNVGPAYQIDYRFDEGWKYLIVNNTDPKLRAIKDEPAAFGIWIYGDDQRLVAPRMRVFDASGQTWQPTYGDITWKGWRFVRLELTPSITHWGGAKDHVLHFPLQWDQIFLLDNTSRKATKGTIYIAAPVVLY